MKKKKGFTLLELLVVIAIIGMISTLAVVALSSARSKSRDSRRLGDMRSLRTAMELAFDSQNDYQLTGCNTTTKLVSSCTSLAPYLPNYANFNDPNGSSACTSSSSAICNYAFASIPADNSTSYTVYFYVEGDTSIGNSGEALCQLTPTSISCP